MIAQIPWVERTFEFQFPIGLFPVIIERLRGTIYRLNAMTDSIPENELSLRQNEKWSIKEHIGHLYDLEELWYGRVEDFLAGKVELRAADMSNAKTQQANHNKNSLAAIIRDFTEARNRLINKTADLDEHFVSLKALHPRLQQPMRLIDSLFFVAEHDDHHLAGVRGILARRQS